MPSRYYLRKMSSRKTRVSKKIKKYVKKALSHGAEMKQYTIDAVNNNIATTGTVFPFNQLLVQGPGEADRIGNQIKMGWFKLHLNVNLTAASTNGYTVGQVVRILVFSMKDARGATPAVSGSGISVLTTPGNAANLYMSEVRDEFKALSHIYYDKIHVLNPPEVLANTGVGFTAAANSALQHQKPTMVTIFRKFKIPKLVTFNDNSGTAAQLARNQLFLLIITDSTNNTPQLDYLYTMGYIDC